MCFVSLFEPESNIQDIWTMEEGLGEAGLGEAGLVPNATPDSVGQNLTWSCGDSAMNLALGRHQVSRWGLQP